MNIGQIFEMIMLICFGLSWPINALKAYRARTAKSTSLFFTILIIVGYIGGISAKIYKHELNIVFIFYVINIAIVLVNLLIYFRNLSLDRKNEMEENGTMILKPANA